MNLNHKSRTGLFIPATMEDSGIATVIETGTLQRIHRNRGLAGGHASFGTAAGEDENLLEAIRKGEALGLEQWVDILLESYSSSPRAAKGP